MVRGTVRHGEVSRAGESRRTVLRRSRVPVASAGPNLLWTAHRFGVRRSEGDPLFVVTPGAEGGMFPHCLCWSVVESKGFVFVSITVHGRGIGSYLPTHSGTRSVRTPSGSASA